MISLSDLDDRDMRDAKSGEWYRVEAQRALSNNSAVYENKPDNIGTFMEEWLALYKSGSGERGIFNRQASKKLQHVTKEEMLTLSLGLTHVQK